MSAAASETELLELAVREIRATAAAGADAKAHAAGSASSGREGGEAPAPIPSRLLAPPEGGAHHGGGPMQIHHVADHERREPVGEKADGLTRRQLRGRQLSFVSGVRTPEPGLDPLLVTTARANERQGRPTTYGFVLLETAMTSALAAELERHGAFLLGRHDQAYKARLPSEPSALEAIAALPAVRWIGRSEPRQRKDSALDRALEKNADPDRSYPVIVNLFEADSNGDFRRRMDALGVVVGRFDPDLVAYLAALPAALVDDLIELDFVLYVELMPTGHVSHDQSMPAIGMDYLRPGGFGTNFDGAPIIFGIMDSGFMVGSAAPVSHQDLDKWGCGRNFTSDAAGVWNDQNGHGTHVVGTVLGTGTAQARYRGAAPGLSETSATRLRAAKVFNSANSFQGSWVLDAMDYMDDASDCGGTSQRPEVINFSGGTFDCTLIGTDSLSRKLDEKVWLFRQFYAVAAGNSGPGATTVCSPGVAKNATTVGSVIDFGYLTVGDVANSSSRGPTGDGRMKPSLAAPGHFATSANAGTTGGYLALTGTSMASPHVAGLATTLMHHYPDFRGRPHMTRAYLMASSLPHDDNTFPSDNDGAPTGDRNRYGLGRISTYAAHWAFSGGNGWNGSWAWGTIDGTQFASTDVVVPAGTDRLVVVLSWDEPAASAGASRAVSDDFDLWIDRDANCTGGSYPGACGEHNSLSFDDNVEYVVIENPAAGTYRLKAAPFSVAAARPVAIAAVVIRGDTTPNTGLTAVVSNANPTVGNNFTVTTTVSNPSWIASGVHLARTSFPGGATLLDVTTTREDNTVMGFGTNGQLTLGNVHAGDSRSVAWTFRAATAGQKTLSFRSWSENGGTNTASVVVTPTLGFVFSDGFESGNFSAWSTVTGGL